MKQVDAARKVFRELAAGVDKLPSWTAYSSGSEYSHKLVSNLFNRDKKMRPEVEKLTSQLDRTQMKIFRQQMSIKLDQMFGEKLIPRKSFPKRAEEESKTLDETTASLKALGIEV